MDQLQKIPILEKNEILNQERGKASPIFHRPLEEYSRFHQTSGSRGIPMPVLDTPQDWQWWLECWQYVLDAAEVTSQDVAMMAFSFGPFIGFWSANDALVGRGALVVPGGGLSSLARLHLIEDCRCTVLCCTPTYALHLSSVARQHGVSIQDSPISRIIVAGEPGGSIPSIREAIQSQWHARVVDHAGASELGAWGFPSPDGSGLHIVESEFIAEFLIFDDKGNVVRQAEPDESSELVMTNLGRMGGPLLRYRTGDVVQYQLQHNHPCKFVHLPGGIRGRSDDMIVIRGVNVFPSSIEAIVRELEPVAEFRMIATTIDEMDQLEIEVEVDGEQHSETEARQRIETLQEVFRDRLALRIPVTAVTHGVLPRSEGKSARWVDRRS